MKSPTFVEYEGDYYVVVGIGTDRYHNEYFQIIRLKDHCSLSRAVLEVYSRTVLIEDVIEITDPDTIASIMILYG